MEYKGYVVIQAYNGHLWIYRNGALVLRVSQSGKKTDAEIRELMDGIIAKLEPSQERSPEHSALHSLPVAQKLTPAE